MTEVRRRRGDYGVDGDFRVVPAAAQVALLAATTAAATGLAVRAARARHPILAALAGYLAAVLALLGVSYGYTTRTGKFRVWDRILRDLALRGDEDLLDLGCGRGAVLLAAAELLPRGHAVGIDLWQADQTGNAPEVTLRNAELEGVADRVSVRTGDVTELPFADGSFDVVVSNLVIHNIPTATGRTAAVDEAVRVLRPGGRLVLADLMHTGDHAARLRTLGLDDVRVAGLGWRMWWGGPWLPTRLVTARAPSVS
jgi:arsenite methyltransferase